MATILAVDRSGQFSRDRKKIPDETVVGDTENGRFRVLVDRDDHFRILYAGECCIAPEIPTAIYSCGATILPA